MFLGNPSDFTQLLSLIHLLQLHDLHHVQYENTAANAKNRLTSPAKKNDALQQTEQSLRRTDGESNEFHFGGLFGAASLMVGFPLLMWYM
jgi:hypothetical protein